MPFLVHTNDQVVPFDYDEDSYEFENGGVLVVHSRRGEISYSPNFWKAVEIGTATAGPVNDLFPG